MNDPFDDVEEWYNPVFAEMFIQQCDPVDELIVAELNHIEHEHRMKEIRNMDIQKLVENNE